MKTLSVPQTTYINYELTGSDEFILDLLLNFNPLHYVASRRAVEEVIAQKVLAIKWWRTRFPHCGLKEAKDAVDAYYTNSFADGK